MKKYMIGVMVILLYADCTSFLTVDPEEIIAVEDAFSSYESAEKALAGVYANFSGYQNATFYNKHIPMYADLAGGNVVYTNYDDERSFLGLTYDFRLTPDYEDSDFSDVYSEGYTLLYAINTLIEKATGIPEVTQEEVNLLLAEAYALRALVHFYLVRLYAQPYNFSSMADHPGIVLILKPLRVTDSAPGRATVAETYDQIIKDLLTSISFYGSGTAAHTNTTGNARSWLTEDAVKAILAKGYLYTNNWKEAIGTASEVINDTSVPFLNASAYIEEFTDELPGFSEALFALETTVLTSAITATLYANYNLDYLLNTSILGDLSTHTNAMAASEDLLQLYNDNDIRKTALLQPIMVTFSDDTQRTYFFTKKYASSFTYIPIIRISEVYLIRAEAYARIQNQVAAIADLDRIRHRADAMAPATVYVSEEELITTIAMERRKELAFEGDTFYDLARLGKNITRIDCEAIRCNITYPGFNYALPIPQESIDGNSKIIQNEGY